ncbi:MAG TPA: recombinase family protein, partial [Myxococcaceae bacterium]|nr:recombinase family protein [Myxococcaceae bacterium]
MAKPYSSTRITAPAKPQQAPKAYSYLRFSTPEQEEGDSIRRQITNTQAYARELGLELDDTLRFEDKGVSAFRGKNSSEGALAEFLENVKAGKVPEGSFLIVEALDRVSRENPYEAMDVLNGILRQGISVAVASEREVYSRESLRKHPFEMLKPLMRFQTAHEESKKKSYRTLENWKAKRDLAAQGKVMSTQGP